MEISLHMKWMKPWTTVLGAVRIFYHRCHALFAWLARRPAVPSERIRVGSRQSRRRSGSTPQADIELAVFVPRKRLGRNSCVRALGRFTFVEFADKAEASAADMREFTI